MAASNSPWHVFRHRSTKDKNVCVKHTSADFATIAHTKVSVTIPRNTREGTHPLLYQERSSSEKQRVPHASVRRAHQAGRAQQRQPLRLHGCQRQGGGAVMHVQVCGKCGSLCEAMPAQETSLGPHKVQFMRLGAGDTGEAACMRRRTGVQSGCTCTPFSRCHTGSGGLLLLLLPECPMLTRACTSRTHHGFSAPPQYVLGTGHNG